MSRSGDQMIDKMNSDPYALPEGVKCAELEEWANTAFGDHQPEQADAAIAALCALVRDEYRQKKAAVEVGEDFKKSWEQAEAKLAAAEAERDEWEWVARRGWHCPLGEMNPGEPGSYVSVTRGGDYIEALRARYRAQKEEK